MADNVEIQGLEFQIIGDSVSAEDSLNKLKNTLIELKNAVKGGVSGIRTTAKQIEALKTALSGFDNSKTQAMKDIASGLTALGSVGKVTISSSIPKQLTALKTALTGLDTTSAHTLTELGNALRPLGELGRAHLTSFVTQLGTLPALLRDLETVNLDRFNVQIMDLGEALRPLADLGRAHMTSFFNQLERLPAIVRELDTVDMDRFTRQMQELAAAMRPFAEEMQRVANGFSAFPSRIQRLITSTERYNDTVRRATSATNGWDRAMRALSWASIIAGLRKVLSLIARCVKESNDYQEDLNLFTVALGEYAEQAQAYAQKVSDAMGIDLGEWMRAQGVFNTLLTGFGNTADRAYAMSTNLTQLGYDLASFFNISVEDAMQKLQSGISGELEPLRRLGYDLSQARLEAVALSLGIDKAVSSMTQAEKAELRYYAIMTQVTTAQGDMARTLESPANQLRVLKAQVEMCARSIGNIFIPALNAILPYAIAVVQVIREVANAIAELFGFELAEVDYSGVNSLGSSAEDAADGFEDATAAAKKLKNATAGFDELNIISQDTDAGVGDIAGTSGSGFDFELPTYDFIGDAVNEQVAAIREQLQPALDWVLDHLEEILSVAKTIAVVLLGLKIGTSLYNGITTAISMFNGLKKLLTTLGFGKLLGDAGAFFELMREGYSFVEVFDAAFPKLSAFIGKVGGALKSAWSSISAFFAGIPGMALAGLAMIIVGIPTFIKGLYDALTEGIDWLSATLIGAGATLTGAGIGAIIGALGGPIGMGVGALIGLVVGLITDFTIWVVQHWEEVSAWFSDLGQKIGGFLTDCWNGIKSVWSTVSEWFDTNVIQPVTQFFTQLWQNIVDVWNGAVEWFDTTIFTPLSNAVQAVTDWIATFFEGCWIIVQAVWIVASDWFRDKVIDPIRKWFKETTEKISKFFSDCWEGIKNVWSAVTGWFSTNIIEPVRAWFNDVTTKIAQFFSDAWAKIKNLWSTVTNWFVTSVINPVRDKFYEITGKVAQFFSDAWTKVKNTWSAAKDWFKTSVIDPVVQRFQTALENIKNAFRNAFNGIKDFIKGIFNGIIGNIEGVINRVISGFNGLIGKFNNVVEWAADIVGTNWKGLKTLSLVNLPRLKDGGFVDEGQLFIAREAGAEMVGSMNNRTAVANNDQIVEGIRAGVYEAVIAAMSSTAQKGEQIIKVFLDGKEITANVEKHQRERGVSIMGGVVYG